MTAQIVDLIGMAANIVVALAAVGGVILAFRGLGEWRSEKTWSREVELAEELLVQLHKKRDLVRSLRSSFQSYAPRDAEEGESQFSEETAKFLGLTDSYQERFDKLSLVNSHAYASGVYATIRWGNEIENLLGQIQLLERRLYYWVGQYLRSQDPSRRGAPVSKSEFAVVFGDWGEEDLFGSEYEALFERSSDYLKGRIRQAQ